METEILIAISDYLKRDMAPEWLLITGSGIVH